MSDEFLSLTFEYEGMRRYPQIDLARINNGYGGRPRTFFLCPGCGKRVRKLYFKGGRFRCRVCAKLNYYCQQVTHNEGEAAWRMERILQKDFGINTRELAPMDMQYMLPDKPKWMRWATYSAKAARLRRAQEGYHEAFTAGARRILGKRWG